MNIIERILVKNGNRSLLKSKSLGRQLVDSGFVGYSEYLSTINDCYQKIGYWHGTGRYHYSHKNNSRYEDIDFSVTIDILESILTEGGMRPHREPWLEKIQRINTATISLSPYRMYARLYSELYQYQGDSLRYQFGTVKLWYKIFLTVQLLDGKFLLFLITKGLFRLANRATYKNIKRFISSVNKNSEVVSIYKAHLIRSDIEKNYPILFGIKKELNTITFNPGMQRLEARTDRVITLGDIVSIEVPLSKIAETKNLLEKYNITLPVIPLELGELYCSTLPLEQLVGV
jgi:hypothetical protein